MKTSTLRPKVLFSLSYPSVLLSFLCVLGSLLLMGCEAQKKPSPTKRVAIANLGPHSTLLAITEAFKKEMSQRGYLEGENVEFYESHVNFDQSLIPTMLARLKAVKPHVILTLTTSVSIAAQQVFSETPLVFAAVTDPQEAKLLGQPGITGVSDAQNLADLLKFVRTVLPNVKRVGYPYSPAEVNDVITLKNLRKEGEAQKIEIFGVGVDHPRDIPSRINALRGRVDCLYIGNGNIIQPALPAIMAAADGIHVPIINFSLDAATNHQAVGAYSVSYERLGFRVAEMIDQILQGKKIEELPVFYPSSKDHQGLISQTALSRLGLPSPKTLPNHSKYVRN